MLEKSYIQIILEEIFRHPNTRYTIRELARRTNMSAPTALHIVQILAKEGILQRTSVGRASQVSGNLDNPAYRWQKRIANLRALYECGIIEKLTQEFEDPRAIILFGSYSRGEDIERSDVDIAVITHRQDIVDLSKFEKKLARTISLHCITFGKVSEEFKSNLCNGIVLHGAI
jgi:predicted nucleotidyltransferase